MTSSLIAGTLMHARKDALAQRVFSYPLCMAAIELAELPRLDRELRLFSHNRRNLFALADRDYATGDPVAAHAALLAGNRLAPAARTVLVTNLRVLGYTFNPVSFFLGYDARGELRSVIAEVNNTYGGRFRYLLGPAERLPSGDPTRAGFRAPRELFVSPFLHGELGYDFWFDTREVEAPIIEMFVQATTGARVFTARFTGARRPLTDRALLGAALRYPLMTAQVIGLIHYQAWKLRRAGVPYRRPGADHRPLM